MKMTRQKARIFAAVCALACISQAYADDLPTMAGFKEQLSAVPVPETPAASPSPKAKPEEARRFQCYKQVMRDFIVLVPIHVSPQDLDQVAGLWTRNGFGKWVKKSDDGYTKVFEMQYQKSLTLDPRMTNNFDPFAQEIEMTDDSLLIARLSNQYYDHGVPASCAGIVTKPAKLWTSW